MRRFLKALATFSIIEAIGRYPVMAGSVALMGVGAVIVSATFTTPTPVPVPTAFFSNGNGAGVNNGLKPATGAFQPPSSNPANSMGILLSGSISAGLGFGGVATTTQFALGEGAAFQGLQIGDNGNGLPEFYFQKLPASGSTGSNWLNAQGFNLISAGAIGGGTFGTYNPGYYPFTATGGGCAREPSGVFGSTDNTSQKGGVKITDPGFGCTTVPTITLAAIPNSGAQQATGAGSVATTCAANSPVTGNFTVTAQVAVAHGITPGQTYTLQGFTPTGYNTTYLALPGSSGTTLVGMPSTATTGTCPATVGTEGTALGGTGGTITLPAIATIGATGITTKNAQRFCALITENGQDSSFPGSQAIAAVDDHGNPLPGSPALFPLLNQGAANFTGYTVTGTQSSGNLALNVTAMNPYTITGATWAAASGNTPAQVTFTTATAPMFEPGSEFTVTGMTPSGYNQTYVAVAPLTTTGTTITATPLSGPLGTPQALANPGSFVSGGSMVSVIMPGMRIQGQFLTTTLGVIAPFGTLGGTGTGGVGTYDISANPISFAFGFSIPSTGILTISGATTQTLAIGTNFTGSDSGGGTTSIAITGFGTGTGLNGTYQTNYTGGSGGTHTFVATTVNGVGTPASPVTLFAVNPFYQTMVGIAGTGSGSLTPPGTGYTTAPVAQATIGDFATTIGAESTTTVPGGNSTGWSGNLGDIADLWMPGGFPTQTGGEPSTSTLASLCKKQTTIPQFAATNGYTVHSYYPLSDSGIDADASVAQFTGSISGTTLTVSSTQTGALTGSGTATIAGAGITGCPRSCPTITLGVGPTYTLSASGGTVGSEAMTAGAFAPAVPTPTSAINGFISGNTLTVTSAASTSPQFDCHLHRLIKHRVYSEHYRHYAYRDATGDRGQRQS